MKLEIRPPSIGEWDPLVQKSHQGSLYCLTEWIDPTQQKRLVAISDGEVIAGLVFNEGFQPLPFIPYTGLLLTRREMPKVADLLISTAEPSAPISVWNAPSLVDTRPFAHRPKPWVATIKYHFFIDKTCRPFPDLVLGDTPYEAPLEVEADRFSLTELEKISAISQFKSVQYWRNNIGACLVGRDCQDRGYIILGNGKWQGVTWQLLPQFKDIDCGGANSQMMNQQKRVLGGKLRTVYGLRFNG